MKKFIKYFSTKFQFYPTKQFKLNKDNTISKSRFVNKGRWFNKDKYYVGAEKFAIIKEH